MVSADAIARILELNKVQFAELLQTLHTCRFTGAITLKFLNGEPQEAEFGRPHVVVFPRPGTKSLDTGGG